MNQHGVHLHIGASNSANTDTVSPSPFSLPPFSLPGLPPHSYSARTFSQTGRILYVTGSTQVGGSFLNQPIVPHKTQDTSAGSAKPPHKLKRMNAGTSSTKRASAISASRRPNVGGIRLKMRLAPGAQARKLEAHRRKVGHRMWRFTGSTS